MCLFTHARLSYGPGKDYTSDNEMPRDLTDLDTRLFTVRTLLSSPSNLEFQENGSMPSTLGKTLFHKTEGIEWI